MKKILIKCNKSDTQEIIDYMNESMIHEAKDNYTLPEQDYDRIIYIVDELNCIDSLEACLFVSNLVDVSVITQNVNYEETT